MAQHRGFSFARAARAARSAANAVAVSAVPATTTSVVMSAATSGYVPLPPIDDAALDAHVAGLDDGYEGNDRKEIFPRFVEVMQIKPHTVVAIRMEFERWEKAKTRTGVRFVIFHKMQDPESVCAGNILLNTPEGRAQFGVVENVEIFFIDSGALKPGDPLIKRIEAVFGVKLKPEQINAAYLEQHCQCLFIDCGGGGALLDSHGRPENAVGSNVSTLDIVLAICLEIAVVYPHKLRGFALLSVNDKSGEAMARAGKVRWENWWFTEPTWRQGLMGQNALALEEGMISFHRIFRFGCMVEAGAEGYFAYIHDRIATLCECDDFDFAAELQRLHARADGTIDWCAACASGGLCEGLDPQALRRTWNESPGKMNWDTAEARHAIRAYVLDNVLAHLPKPLTDAQIAQRIANGAGVLASLKRERQKYEEDIADLKKHLQWAIRSRNDQWVRGDADMQTPTLRSVRVLDEVYLDKRFVEGGEQHFHPVCARVYFLTIRSESPRVGEVARNVIRGLCQQIAKWHHILAAWSRERNGATHPTAAGKLAALYQKATKYGIPLNSFPPLPKVTTVEPAAQLVTERSAATATNPVAVASAAVVGAEIPSADISNASPATVDASEEIKDAQAPEIEALEPGAGDGLSDEEEEDAARKLGPNDLITTGGSHYKGLTRASRDAIVALVGKIAPEVIMCQIRDPLTDAQGSGVVANCKYILVTTHINVAAMMEAIRAEQVRRLGKQAELEDPDLRNARRLAHRTNGRYFVARDYRPDFGTLGGCIFNTNRTLPHAGLSDVELTTLAIAGLMRRSGEIATAVAAGQLALTQLPWQVVAAETGLAALTV